MKDLDIYHDNGAAFGRRTRFFRNAEAGGVEWIYGVDYAGGCSRWYGYLATGGHETIASLKISGMFLSRLDNGATSPYREDLTACGPQLVMPGFERRPPDNGKPAQLSLF